MIRLAAFAIAACIGGSAFAQDTAKPATPDSLTQQVGAEMDRAASGANAPATPPSQTLSTTLTGGRLLRTTAALFVVIALILIGYWAVGRWGKRVPMLAGSNLGKVLGRLYLDRGTALHFVQVGEKVLLVGVNANSISLLGEYPAGAQPGRDTPVGTSASSPAVMPFNPDSFLAELRTKSQELAASQRLPRAEEDEIATLRGDIQRLQRYLREENREHED